MERDKEQLGFNMRVFKSKKKDYHIFHMNREIIESCTFLINGLILTIHIDIVERL